MSDKAIETNAKRVLDRYVLADTVEIKQEFSQDLYPLLDNYENHIKDVAARQKMTAYVNLNPEARQIVAGFFQCMVAELNNIADPTDLAGVSLLKLSDQVDRDIDARYTKPQDRLAHKNAALDRDRFKFIVDQIDANNSPCVSKFMHDFVTRVRINGESTLAKDGDSENYFKAKLDGLLRKYKSNDFLIALMGKFFDLFLKSLAHVISRFIWFDHKTVSKDILFAILYTHDMPFDIISDLSGKIRERAPPKKKAVAAVAGATATDTTAPAVSPVDTLAAASAVTIAVAIDATPATDAVATPAPAADAPSTSDPLNLASLLK